MHQGWRACESQQCVGRPAATQEVNPYNVNAMQLVAHKILARATRVECVVSQPGMRGTLNGCWSERVSSTRTGNAQSVLPLGRLCFGGLNTSAAGVWWCADRYPPDQVVLFLLPLHLTSDVQLLS